MRFETMREGEGEVEAMNTYSNRTEGQSQRQSGSDPSPAAARAATIDQKRRS
jgi:hypothetical protein